ncbi:MAG: T9SS type A sorting domain-containing protein [Ignavibacteria bacterium]|nr:T9SS type A sorting domain-containing protein [Ignavibacteria bacterium]
MNTTVKFAILIFLIVFTNTVHAQWYTQNSGTNYPLKSVKFTDANTGYTCGYNTILKTTNAGLNWVKTFLQGNHQSLTFIDNNTGFICSDSGKIFKTTNAGLNWESRNSGTIRNLTSISFYDSQTGIITGHGKTLLKTTSGGENWFSIANIIWEVDFLSSRIIDVDNYFVTGTDSYIVKTTNGGANWIPYTHGDPNPLFTIEFIDENFGFATGCCGMFMSTTNAGVNWTDNFYLSQGFTFYNLKFTDDNTGYCVGDNGMIYRSTNSGVRWDSTVSGTDQTLYAIFMFNSTTGFVTGGFGTILKTTNGGGPGFPIGITQTSQLIPGDFSLGQNYPNPFNPATKINFEVKSKGRGEKAKMILTVYDVTGKVTILLLNSELLPGSYEVDFDGSNLPSGVYYYMLRTEGYRETRKMVLLK